MYWNSLLFCMTALLVRLRCVGMVERTRYLVRSAGGKGLGEWRLLPLEGFGEALQTQVLVPQLGESLMLLVQLEKVHIVVADDGAAALLSAGVIVAPVLCEAPDYVKQALLDRGTAAFMRRLRLREST